MYCSDSDSQIVCLDTKKFGQIGEDQEGHVNLEELKEKKLVFRIHIELVCMTCPLNTY